MPKLNPGIPPGRTSTRSNLTCTAQAENTGVLSSTGFRLELDRFIADDVLMPMTSAMSTLDQVAALFQQMALALDSPQVEHVDHSRLKLLADLGAFAAQDMTNFLDAHHERVRDETAPELFRVAGGAQ